MSDFIPKKEYELRADQMVIQYGAGAMVSFKDQTLMSSAPEYWCDKYIIKEPRLANRLGVSHFGRPIDKKDNNGAPTNGLTFVRFPEWYYCPQCKRFQTLDKWKKEYDASNNARATSYKRNDPNMTTDVRCFNPKTNCNGRQLVVTRFVMVCNMGHIDDFPWIEFVHWKSDKPLCQNPELKINDSGRSESLDSFKVTCTCGASATLSKMLSKNGFDDIKAVVEKNPKGFKNFFACSGRHPWKDSSKTNQDGKNCDGETSILIRGSSSVYFPVTVSSLAIPSDELKQKVFSCALYDDFCSDANPQKIEKNLVALKKAGAPISDNQIAQVVSNTLTDEIDNYAKKISKFLNDPNLSENDVKQILQSCLNNDISKDGQNDSANQGISSVDEEQQYREEEYNALTGNAGFASKDFEREDTNITDYINLPAVTKISLINKVREVQAFVGFSRTQPMSFSKRLLKFPVITSGNGTKVKFVKIKEYMTPWYPGYEVRGEGIFIEFDTKKIDEWSQCPPTISRIRTMQTNYKNSYMSNTIQRKLSAGYVLLHTLSHLLINQLSFDCGYSVASLKERIYFKENSYAGIFIYTACGDSEGSLGGLVRQGHADIFPRIFNKALEKAAFCSNDPVCSCSNGQGKESLNLAACHSCVLLPETCCENFNTFLDRGMVAGTMDNPDIGFF